MADAQFISVQEDDREEDKESQFFRAVYKNDFEHVRILLQDNEVDVNKLNISHKSGLYLAIQNENYSIVKLLLEHGADPNLISYCNVYCSYETPVVSAARLQNMDLVELLLEHNCQLENDRATCYREGKSALQWAASFGNIPMASLMVKQGADVNWIGPHFHTAIHHATIADKVEMVDWLLSSSAEVNINGDGRTPLHLAAVRGNFAIVKLVADKTKIDLKDSFGFSSFALACLRGHRDIVDYLYSACPNRDDLDLEDSLRIASENGHINVMSFLLEKNANVNARSKTGETALSIACHGRHGQQDQLKAVQLLLENGAIINVIESRGYTPLTMALLREQNDIAALLIQHGASLDAVSPSSDSPLHIAFNTSNPLLVKYLIQAGCHFCKEKWFNDEAADQKITEMDFSTPGPARFRRDSDLQKATWEWIKVCMCQPRTLSQLARRRVRQHLMSCGDGSSILGRIKYLPLPESIKKFVALEDVLMEY